MAKKSSKKAFYDFLTVALSGGVYGFLALPFVKSEASILGQSSSWTASAYQLLDFEANSGIATVVLLTIIFAGVLAFFALCKLVFDAGFLKSKAASKYLGFATVLFALALIGVSIAAMIVIPKSCSTSSLGGWISAGTTAQWGGLIANLAAGILALGTSYLSTK